MSGSTPRRSCWLVSLLARPACAALPGRRRAGTLPHRSPRAKKTRRAARCFAGRGPSPHSPPMPSVRPCSSSLTPAFNVPPGPRPIGSDAESHALKVCCTRSLRVYRSLPTQRSCDPARKTIVAPHSNQIPGASPVTRPQHALDRLETIRDKYPDGPLRLETRTGADSGEWLMPAAQRLPPIVSVRCHSAGQGATHRLAENEAEMLVAYAARSARRLFRLGQCAHAASLIARRLFACLLQGISPSVTF